MKLSWKEPKIIEQTSAMQHGIGTEINGLAVLVSKVLPVLLQKYHMWKKGVEYSEMMKKSLVSLVLMVVVKI